MKYYKKILILILNSFVILTTLIAMEGVKSHNINIILYVVLFWISLNFILTSALLFLNIYYDK